MIRKGDWKYIHFTYYDDLLFNVADDPGEFINLAGKPETADIQHELESILHSTVNPEEVTERAFAAQKAMLGTMANRMSEEELYGAFVRRMGPGLARNMAKLCKLG